MRLLKYNAAVKVFSASGLLGNYAVGAEAKGRIEIKGEEAVFQNMKGMVEVCFKLDSVTKFSWVLGSKNYEWTKWFPVQINGSPLIMEVDGPNGSGKLVIDISNDVKTAGVSGSMMVKNFVFKKLINKAHIEGAAQRTHSEDMISPN